MKARLLCLSAVLVSMLTSNVAKSDTCDVYLYQWIVNNVVVMEWISYENCVPDGGTKGGGPGCPSMVSVAMDSIEGSADGSNIAHFKGRIVTLPESAGIDATFTGPATAGAQVGVSGPFDFVAPLDAIPDGGATYSVTVTEPLGCPNSVWVQAEGVINRTQLTQYGDIGAGMYFYGGELNHGAVLVNITIQGNEMYSRYASSPGSVDRAIPALRTEVSRACVQSVDNTEFGNIFGASVNHDFLGWQNGSYNMSQDGGYVWPPNGPTAMNFILLEQLWYHSSIGAAGVANVSVMTFIDPSGSIVMGLPVTFQPSSRTDLF